MSIWLDTNSPTLLTPSARRAKQLPLLNIYRLNYLIHNFQMKIKLPKLIRMNNSANMYNSRLWEWSHQPKCSVGSDAFQWLIRWTGAPVSLKLLPNVLLVPVKNHFPGTLGNSGRWSGNLDNLREFTDALATKLQEDLIGHLGNPVRWEWYLPMNLRTLRWL